MVPMEVGKGDYDRFLPQDRIPHDITSEVPYSRPRVDDANIDGVIGGYKDATRTPTVLVELSSAHRNRSSTSVNDDLDVIAAAASLRFRIFHGQRISWKWWRDNSGS